MTCIFSGQLQLLASEYHSGSHRHLSPDVISKIVALQFAAQNASKIGLDSVRIDDSQYFSEFSSMVLQPWTFMKPHRKLEASLRWEIPQYKAKMKGNLLLVYLLILYIVHFVFFSYCIMFSLYFAHFVYCSYMEFFSC